MNDLITFFPRLNDELEVKLNFEPHDSFITEENGIKVSLYEGIAIDDPDKIVLYDDKNNAWSLSQGNLVIERKINLTNTNLLFGKNGIVCNDAIIGVGLRWFSKESHQRDILEIGEIKKETKTFSESKQLIIQKSTLIGIVGLETILFIKKSGVPDTDEMHLSNKQGIILGELDLKEIRLDGEGPEFPIFFDNTQSAKEPLWNVYLDWSNPAEDAFIDSFKIFLNTNNTNFCFLNPASDRFDSHLIVEIVSSALTLLILKLKGSESSSRDWEIMEKGKDLEEGSVSYLVHYYKETKKLDFSTPSTTLETFRIAFENVGRNK